MDKNDRFWFSLWCMIAFAIVVTILGCMNLYNKRVADYVDKGYCETMNVGTQTPLWQKCK